MYSIKQIDEVLNSILSQLSLNDVQIRKFTSHDNHVYKASDFIIKIASAKKYNAAMYKYYDLYSYLKQLSFEIPEIIKIGSIDGINYSVLKYVDGDVWDTKDDITEDLCRFYREFYNIKVDNDIMNKYGDNSMNFYRGDHISVYADSFYSMLDKYSKVLNVSVLRELFDEGLNVKVTKKTFVHGDNFMKWNCHERSIE